MWPIESHGSEEEEVSDLEIITQWDIARDPLLLASVDREADYDLSQ